MMFDIFKFEERKNLENSDVVIRENEGRNKAKEQELKEIKESTKGDEEEFLEESEKKDRRNKGTNFIPIEEVPDETNWEEKIGKKIDNDLEVENAIRKTRVPWKIFKKLKPEEKQGIFDERKRITRNLRDEQRERE